MRRFPLLDDRPVPGNSSNSMIDRFCTNFLSLGGHFENFSFSSFAEWKFHADKSNCWKGTIREKFHHEYQSWLCIQYACNLGLICNVGNYFNNGEYIISGIFTMNFYFVFTSIFCKTFVFYYIKCPPKKLFWFWRCSTEAKTKQNLMYIWY